MKIDTLLSTSVPNEFEFKDDIGNVHIFLEGRWYSKKPTEYSYNDLCIKGYMSYLDTKILRENNDSFHIDSDGYLKSSDPNIQQLIDKMSKNTEFLNTLMTDKQQERYYKATNQDDFEITQRVTNKIEMDIINDIINDSDLLKATINNNLNDFPSNRKYFMSPDELKRYDGNDDNINNDIIANIFNMNDVNRSNDDKQDDDKTQDDDIKDRLNTNPEDNLEPTLSTSDLIPIGYVHTATKSKKQYKKTKDGWVDATTGQKLHPTNVGALEQRILSTDTSLSEPKQEEPKQKEEVPPADTSTGNDGDTDLDSVAPEIRELAKRINNSKYKQKIKVLLSRDNPVALLAADILLNGKREDALDILKSQDDTDE